MIFTYSITGYRTFSNREKSNQCSPGLGSVLVVVGGYSRLGLLLPADVGG